MNSRFCFTSVCAIFFLISSPYFCGDCFGQLTPSRQSGGSTVIEIGGATGTSSVKVPEPEPRIPTSLNARQLRWENILAQPYPTIFEGKMTCGQMLELLRDVGLPVSLDQSARDDDFTENDQVTFLNPSLPLYDSLQDALDERNAVLMMVDDRLTILSADVVGSPEFLTTITFDVSSLMINSQEINDSIRESIAADDWDDTNGDGTLVINSIGNRKLMTVSQSYDIQRKIHRHLENLIRLQGNSTAIAQTQGSMYSESQVIQLPSDRAALGAFGNPDGSYSGGFGGGGIGGYGLGGGVF